MTEHMTRLRNWVLPFAALALLAGCDAETAPPTEIEGTGNIEGMIYYDMNRDGLYDPSAGDSVMTGIDLVLLSRGTNEAIPNGAATTGADGRFAMNNVPLGTHDLMVDEATAPQAAVFCRNPIPVSVYPGEMQYQSVTAQQSCLVDIAVAEEQDLGSYVTVAGIAVSGSGQIRGGYVHIEDESGGIRLFDYDLDGMGIAVGDRLEISGTLAEYGGDLQITGVTVNALEADVADPVPTVVSTAELMDAGVDPVDPLLGRLIQVQQAEMVSEFGADGMHYRNALIDTGDGTAIVRVEEAVADTPADAGLMTVGNCYTITGVAGTFSQEGQIFPRTTADIVEVACP